jgi:hypothetical protein
MYFTASIDWCIFKASIDWCIYDECEHIVEDRNFLRLFIVMFSLISTFGFRKICVIMRTDRRDLRAQTASSPADTCHVYHLDQDNDSDFRKRFVSYGRDCWEILVYIRVLEGLLNTLFFCLENFLSSLWSFIFIKVFVADTLRFVFLTLSSLLSFSSCSSYNW